MRADGEIHVEDGVDTQWGGLMADSTGQQLDSVSTLTKSGDGTLELTASGTATSAVRVEDGTLKGEAENIIPYVSSLWVGEDGVFETGQNQDIRSIDATSGGDIDITDGTVLRLTQQDTHQALDASLFSGDGTLVNATDGVTLTGELNTNLETDSLTYLSDVTVNGDLTNTSGAVSLQNGVAGDTLTVNGDYTGGGTLFLDSELNGDDSASDQLVLNGNTSGNTTVVVNPITGIGEPTSTGIKVVDFAADPRSFKTMRSSVWQEAATSIWGRMTIRWWKITTTGICDRKKSIRRRRPIRTRLQILIPRRIPTQPPTRNLRLPTSRC